MISVQELLNQTRPGQADLGRSIPEKPQAKAFLSDEGEEMFEREAAPSGQAKHSDQVAYRAQKAVRPFSQLRQQMAQRQLLGLLSLGGGYGCMGWALQMGQAPVFIWVAVWAIAGVWALRRSRPWHSLLPFLISSLVLVGVMLPLWVMGLLVLPIVAFFGCVWMMDGQTLRSALLSSLMVYSLSLTAAGLGAIALGLMGTEFRKILFNLGWIAAGYVCLSLFPRLHRRHQRPVSQVASDSQMPKTWRRLLAKVGRGQGQFVGVALMGLLAGALLSRTDWVMVTALTRQILQ